MPYDYIAHERRAVAAGIAVLLTIVGVGAWLFRAKEDAVASHATVSGVVRAANPRGEAASDASRASALPWVAQVELPGGGHTYVAFSRQPRVGETIRLTEVRHASGKLVYVHDPVPE